MLGVKHNKVLLKWLESLKNTCFEGYKDVSFIWKGLALIVMH